MLGRLVAALCLVRCHQCPLLGSGLHGFFVGGKVEVGELVDVQVAIIEMDVLVVVVAIAAGTRALRL
jgi:hypothetical protein